MRPNVGAGPDERSPETPVARADTPPPRPVNARNTELQRHQYAMRDAAHQGCRAGFAPSSGAYRPPPRLLDRVAPRHQLQPPPARRRLPPQPFEQRRQDGGDVVARYVGPP